MEIWLQSWVASWFRFCDSFGLFSSFASEGIKKAFKLSHQQTLKGHGDSIGKDDKWKYADDFFFGTKNKVQTFEKGEKRQS